MNGVIPIVTLDKIYINSDLENIYFLDCTRINFSNLIISRMGESLDSQIERLVNTIKSKEIILADDVVFTGSVLRDIINRFNKYGITTVSIISSISTIGAYNYFKSNLKYGIRTNYILGDMVIDQVCERDFYFGIAGSGIMVKEGNKLYKSPYFRPFGYPVERASIPNESEIDFSLGCIDRSIYLWEEIEKIKKDKIYIGELPEKIRNTQTNEEVIKVLRKGRDELCKNYK